MKSVVKIDLQTKKQGLGHNTNFSMEILIIEKTPILAVE